MEGKEQGPMFFFCGARQHSSSRRRWRSAFAAVQQLTTPFSAPGSRQIFADEKTAAAAGGGWSATV
jgi:hypothetical protein